MLLTYWHTLRYLKPSQLYERLWFRLYRPRLKQIKNISVRQPISQFIQTAKRQKSLLGPTTFSLLNKIGDVEKLGWQDAQRDNLWRYNQHYFDDLNAIDNQTRSKWHAKLIDRWIEDNPGYSGIGWEPYPTSLRVVNWIKCFFGGFQPSQHHEASLATQANWLSHRLEYHLLGNHLLANAKALYFAGCYFKGRYAAKWLKSARNILKAQISEQILKDGGHFELSPMYHALVLEDLLDLINIAKAYGHTSDVKDWQIYIPQMLLWLKGMSHPDHKIAFFNDSAFGIAPDNSELIDYAERLGFRSAYEEIGSRDFDSSGYIRAVNSKAVLICDVAKIGPDYLPGHAHADTLSFELSLYEQRVFVNSGTSVYGVSDERLRQRGTNAHNTVVIDEKNSSEVWSGFRVARRAYPRQLKVDLNDKEKLIEYSHDGYRRLKGKHTHQRRWLLKNNSLEITDTILGNYHNAVSYFHLHPDISVFKSESDKVVLKLTTKIEVSLKVEGGELLVKESTWHPEFGKVLNNKCIQISFLKPSIKTTINFLTLNRCTYCS